MPAQNILRHTADGTHTIHSPVFHEDYHSKNGALTESRHVYIHAGLNACSIHPIRILEVGMGTGLNAYITAGEAQSRALRIQYHTLEPYPLGPEVSENLNYAEYIPLPGNVFFLQLHTCSWEDEVQLLPQFSFRKQKALLEDVQLTGTYELVYFDAFSPVVQPELWTPEIFLKIFNSLVKGGILVTYCARGQVRRNMQEAGFRTERLPGAPGKREMLRARKE